MMEDIIINSSQGIIIMGTDYDKHRCTVAYGYTTLKDDTMVILYYPKRTQLEIIRSILFIAFDKFRFILMLSLFSISVTIAIHPHLFVKLLEHLFN